LAKKTTAYYTQFILKMGKKAYGVSAGAAKFILLFEATVMKQMIRIEKFEKEAKIIAEQSI
jgi:hypothetical protein